jgi:hypothetical protein
MFEPEKFPEDLEAVGVEAAGQIAAATCRFLLWLAEFDRSGKWGPWECKSAAHWLSWRCGVDLASAWEQLRVARRLGELPTITGAFGNGELSWYQVRALAKIATPETDASLLDIARYSTGTQLARLVVAYRKVLEAQANAGAHAAHAKRSLRYFFDDDGFFVIKGRLSPEEGKVIEAALEATAAQLRAEARRAESTDDPADQAPGKPRTPGRPAGPTPWWRSPRPR